MNKIKILYQFKFLIVIALISSCTIYSHQPFVDEEDTIETPKKIMGKWQIKTMKQEKKEDTKNQKLMKSKLLGNGDAFKIPSIWKINKKTVTFVKKGKNSILNISFFKIEKQLFCQISQMKIKNENIFTQHALQLYSCYKVTLKENNLKLTPLDPDYIEELIADDPLFHYIYIDDVRLLIDNNADQWQEFLQKHYKKGLFENEELSLNFKK